MKITVNGKPKDIPQKKLTHDELVMLAHGPQPSRFDDLTVFTITYAKGPKKKPYGILSHGQEKQLLNGMIFNVIRTDKS